MQVKNKIIEKLDERIREDYYEMLEENVQICKARAGVPIRTNTEVCGDGYLVCSPRAEQEPFCEGRVMPLYAYLPEMRDEAELIAGKTEEEGIKYLAAIVQDQYEPKEVYDYLMQGLKEKTVRNIIDFDTLKEYSDKETGRDISIVDVYHSGKWHCISCYVLGYDEHYIKALDYPLEHDYKKAMRYFAKRLSGADKQAFDKMAGSEAEM